MKKTPVYTIKLAAAFALMVASVALAGSDDLTAGDTPEQPQAQPGSGILVVEPGMWTIDPGTGQPEELSGENPATGTFKFEGPYEAPPVTEKHYQDPPPRPSGPYFGSGVLVETRRKIEPNFYWIGVQCIHLPDLFRLHLDIPADRGVLIVKVVPEAPAAKAGILEHDILLTGNKKPLLGAADVSHLIAEVKDQPITFELIRKGQHKTIQVTPAQNPLIQSPKEQEAAQKPMSPEQRNKFRRWYQQQRSGKNYQPHMRLRFMNPGIILPPDALMHPALPDEMSITIMKKGNTPTQIKVTRGDEVWEVDEKGLNKLPKDIRPRVERMLSGLIDAPETMGPRFDYTPDWSPQTRMPKPSELEAAARERMNRQMEQMNQRIEELRKMIEGIREKKGPEEKK